MNYSIRYKNAGDVVARSELLPFANGLEAMDHGKGEHLIVRLFGVDSRGPTTPGFK